MLTSRFWLRSIADGSDNDGVGQQDQADDFTPITTQDDLNRVIDERINRERAKYADYKDLKAKAAELDRIKNDNQSETDKLAGQIKDLQTQLEASNLSALRARIQASHGISDEDAGLFLTGSDEDTLTRQAQALAKRDGDRKKKPPFVPTQGNQPKESTQNGDVREFTRNLFGKQT